MLKGKLGLSLALDSSIANQLVNYDDRLNVL